MPTDTHIFTHTVKVLASGPLHLTSTTKVWPYCRQKGNPFTLLGHFGLPHTIPATPLDRKMAPDRKPLLSAFATPHPQPSTQNLFSGQCQIRLFQIPGLF